MTSDDLQRSHPEQRTPALWKLLLGAAALAAVVLLLVHGGSAPPGEESEPDEAPRSTGVRIPLPKTPHRDRQDEARGIYILEQDRLSFHLELKREGRFRFLSRLAGEESREAEGTWNLVGNRLTMSYKRVDGTPVEGSRVVRNVYRVRSIVLRDTGLDFPVVLTKRAMIRMK